MQYIKQALRVNLKMVKLQKVKNSHDVKRSAVFKSLSKNKVVESKMLAMKWLQ